MVLLVPRFSAAFEAIWRFGSSRRHFSSLVLTQIDAPQLLAKCLKSGHDFEKEVIANLLEGGKSSGGCLSVHTSAGVPPQLQAFVDALERHLPLKGGGGDWFVSLQSEGASAVMAAVDLCMQLRQSREGGDVSGPISRWKEGVASTSDHGPPSTSLGR